MVQSSAWAIIGLVMIVAGLVRSVRPVRITGLCLLGLALGKLVLFDLTYLDSISRAPSFFVVGLLALARADAGQRIRRHLDDETDARDRAG